MTHVTCRLTAKNRDQLGNRTLGNRVWATFTFFLAARVSPAVQCGGWRGNGDGRGALAAWRRHRRGAASPDRRSAARARLALQHQRHPQRPDARRPRRDRHAPARLPLAALLHRRAPADRQRRHPFLQRGADDAAARRAQRSQQVARPPTRPGIYSDQAAVVIP